jgi:enterochelin esterase-like enzyme
VLIISDLDPEGHVRATTVLDNLIAAGDLPPTLGLFVTPGLRIGHSHVTDRRDMSEGLASLGWSGQADQRQRSFEYDSLTDLLPRFLLEDLLPVIEKEYRISPRGADRAVVGMSSGGIGAFNCAWHFPECFGRVISMCGSFTNIRGGHNYPWIVRNTVPAKPIHKVWLQSGENDLNNAHGSWPLANQELSLALEWAGYSHQLHIGKGTHSIRHGGTVFPDTCRWIWTDDDARGASAQPCL